MPITWETEVGLSSCPHPVSQMLHSLSLTYDERMEGSWTFSPFFCQTYEVTSVAGSAIHLKHTHIHAAAVYRVHCIKLTEL